jgi:Flp pilus assembly protein TadD
MRFHNNGKIHPELYYISAKCLFINDCSSRAKKTIRKALCFKPNNIVYLILFGDICFDIGSSSSVIYHKNKYFDKARESYKKAMLLIHNNDTLRGNLEKKIEKSLKGNKKFGER